MKTDEEIREEAHEMFPPRLEQYPDYITTNGTPHFIDLNWDAREAFIKHTKASQSNIESEKEKYAQEKVREYKEELIKKIKATNKLSGLVKANIYTIL
jgi:hypothetical protein